jgi:hypothetical protein
MSTPLYKKMKNKGTSFYAFPSTSSNPNPHFSKFVLLNIPAKKSEKVLDFSSDDVLETYFDVWTDGVVGGDNYADQMVEALRNYVANHDTVMRESKLNQTNDFYNIKEPQTPTEKIFWKWMRKMGAIDFETAVNKVDWNKYHPDFENPNADTVSNTDFFRKYLWKEREVTQYKVNNTLYLGPTSLGTNIVSMYFDVVSKFKVGDFVYLSGDTDISVSGNTYEILQIDEGVTDSTIYINMPEYTYTPIYSYLYTYLSYHRLVQYIGEINVVSQVHTATKDETEVTAYIPHQAGSTPTVMWAITSDTNYYPGLELPLLSTQIQPEIRGAENLQSPIRQNPGDYPGLYFGEFDTENKTYIGSTGDKMRFSGDYYGVLRNNNVGLDADNYVERLSEFNSDYLDGLTLDFNLNHYLKMKITDESVGFNFDEFNQLVVDGTPPQDFQYNAILWYYEVPTNDGTNSTVNNLYGVTFLNNPGNDDDTNDAYITPYDKLVQNEDHDGLSYVHVLNISQSVDNDTSSLAFDPLTLNNTFGFDLYNNLMSNVAKLNESFVDIINEFVRMNTELNDVKSLVYSQVDMDLIKSKLKNMEDLLKLYSTYQFVGSETVTIDQDYSGVYPTLSFNVKGVEYESVISATNNDIYNYVVSAQADYPVEVPDTNKLFLKITNVDITNYGPLNILLNKDLDFKQTAIIYIDAKDALYSNQLYIYINYDDGTVTGPVKTLFIDKVFLPVDIARYVANDITYATSKWLSSSTFQNVNLVKFSGDTGTITARTVLYMTDANIFGDLINDQLVYVHDLMFLSGTTILDKSGVYSVGSTEFTPMYIKINLDSYGLTPIGVPRVYIYKGVKLEILRVDESPTSTLNDRYLIQKTFI